VALKPMLKPIKWAFMKLVKNAMQYLIALHLSYLIYLGIACALFAIHPYALFGAICAGCLAKDL
jgi:hypothetical protein